VQQQVGQFTGLLDEMNLGKRVDSLFKAADSQNFAQDNS